jgi:oligopeptidase B
MQSRIRAFALVLCLVQPAVARPGDPPAAPKKPHITEIHGLKLEDPYHWLRNRESTEVLDHLKRENDYAKSIMSGTESLQKRLYDEILGRIKQTDMNVPYPERGYLYYSRTEEGKAYSIHCRRKGSMESPEEVLLDVNRLAEGKPFMSAFSVAISPDNKTLAWAQDLTGGRRFTIRFRDLATGKDAPEALENCGGSFAWASDSQTYFYTTLDHAVRPDKVWRSRTGAAKPELIRHESDERFSLGVELTRSNEFILLEASSMKTSEVYTLRADDATGTFRVVEPRKHGTEYSLDHHGDQFFILHNDGEKSLNFQIDAAPESSPARANWKPFIPHRTDTYLTGIDAFKDHLLVRQRRNGLPELRVRALKDGAEHIVEQSETSYAVFPSTNREFDTTRIRFSYTSPVTPMSVFEYDLNTRARTLLKEQPVLGGYDRTKYQVERVFAAAPDGEQVPMTILSLKSSPRDGSAPALLYSYGSYGASTDATFNSANFSLVDRGFVYAIAQIRGGSEKGRAWYESGRMMNKKNTFTDFIAATDHLVKQRYTSPKKLVIRGGSAGGLLMGAVVNMRPDLFAVCIADVPFVDVINTMLDDSLPLTVTEFEQWGNPKVRTEFEYIRTYSPYDNIDRKPYPAILSMTGLHDSQVAYWEPVKWVARLRENTTARNPIVLKINMDAGHGGHSDRYKAIEDNAFRFAFILQQLDMDDDSGWKPFPNVIIAPQ